VERGTSPTYLEMRFELSLGRATVYPIRDPGLNFNAFHKLPFANLSLMEQDTSDSKALEDVSDSILAVRYKNELERCLM
jgi:hypothetical protein